MTPMLFDRCPMCDTPDSCDAAARCSLRDGALGETEGHSAPRARILRDAEALITGPREADYGPPAESFGRVAAMWAAYLGQPVTAAQVCDCLALLKLARLSHDAGHEDSRRDACGYLALGGEVQP